MSYLNIESDSFFDSKNFKAFKQVFPLPFSIKLVEINCPLIILKIYFLGSVIWERFYKVERKI